MKSSIVAVASLLICMPKTRERHRCVIPSFMLELRTKLTTLIIHVVTFVQIIIRAASCLIDLISQLNIFFYLNRLNQC